MADSETRIRHYWQRHVDDDGKPTVAPGSDLAALRRGAGRVAGDVPEMWRHYTTLRLDGQRSPQLAAEHVALTLFAIHQQSKVKPMHVDGIGFGAAMRALRHSDKFSQDAVDRRFTAAATATSFGEVSLHLRGLITQLRAIDQPLNYTRLYDDLVRWQHPERVVKVRRVWGSQYFAAPNNDEPGDSAPQSAAAEKREPFRQRRPVSTVTSVQESK